MNTFFSTWVNERTAQEQANIDSSLALILDAIAFCAPLLLLTSLAM
ncbi:hypothetical protein KO495_06875 [Colwellia sp. D2M02]|nr:hypothetical protein [Colwellia sp. D2M02]MBU2893048.1 hypothetical protein [Colwellia sp. D2M02]